MTRPNTPIIIPLTMIGLTFVFGGIMISREPQLTPMFALAMGLLPIAWVFIEMRKFRGELDDNAKEDRAMIRGSIAAAAVLILVPLSLTVLFTSGLTWITDAIEQRTMGIVFGLVMVFYGNMYGKRPVSLSKGECSPTGQQSFIRFSARIFVVTGLIYTAVWIFAPLDPALPISMTFLVLGNALIIGRAAILRMRKT
jgi:hypothetical protein